MKKQLKNVTLMIIDCVETERAEKVLAICSEDIEFGEIKLLTSLDTNSSYKISIPHIGSIEAFSEFCIKDLHKYVNTDFVLLVQHDGFILNADSWSDQFLKYDYIGAPWFVADWSVKNFNFPEQSIGTWVVGNGGFSLRSKKFLEISSKLSNKFNKYHPEDVSLCVWNREILEENDINFAPIEIAKQFSIEGDDNVVYSHQFGFHGLTWTDISDWIIKNPKWNIKDVYEKDS